ncbi:MAG: DNA-directed RNA polymerase [Nanoarchaeota archaeon]|nr:DNA-directed RNA polymerase [Nanoarchaeota archaeon]|tara:strand:+ start:263 stop:826 length:564 start_codon:yes stop_codon:yes gene_type:complete
MFYELEIQSHVRLPPSNFDDKNLEKTLKERLNEQYEGKIDKDWGIILAIKEISKVGEGVIVPGDGAAYYDTNFKILTFKPEIQEVVLGTVTDITDFGVFFDIGAIDGMIHVSQTMDDFVSISKVGVLTGKESKKVLKTKDKCKARIVAVSYKDLNNPKIGLTMRQPGLGNLQWLVDDKKKATKEDKE